jgi:hypothetical protein
MLQVEARDNEGWNKDPSRKDGSLDWEHVTRVTDTVRRSQGHGWARKGNRNRSGCGEATQVRRDYIMGRVPAPVRDRSRVQLLDEPGEIHILDQSPLEPGNRHATRSPERNDLWRNPSGPGGPLQGPAPGCCVSQSAKNEDPGCRKILARICYSSRRAALLKDHVRRQARR